MRNLQSLLQEQSEIVGQIVEPLGLEYVTERNPVEIGISTFAAAASTVLLPISLPTLATVASLAYLSERTGIGARKHHSPVPFMWPITMPALMSLYGFELLRNSIYGERFYKVNNPEMLEEPNDNEARLSIFDKENPDHITTPILYLGNDLEVSFSYGNTRILKSEMMHEQNYNRAQFSFYTDPLLVEELHQISKEFHVEREKSWKEYENS